MDADTIPEVDVLYKLSLFILNHPDYDGVGCSLRIANGTKIEDFSVTKGALPKAHIENFQIIEYIRSFFGGRIGWDALNATILLSGAFSALKRDLIIKVRGFSHDSLVEDLDIVFKFYVAKGLELKLKIHPEPLAWTQAPTDYHSLAAQRLRWRRGLIQTIIKFRVFFLNPKFGRIGLIQYPFLVLFIILEPFVEVYSVFVTIYSYFSGLLSLAEIMILISLSLILVILLNTSSLSIEENYFSRNKSWRNRINIFFYSLFEIVFYHQFIVLVTIYATLTSISSKRNWGYMKRKKFS